jgi:hypothetical protein
MNIDNWQGLTLHNTWIVSNTLFSYMFSKKCGHVLLKYPVVTSVSVSDCYLQVTLDGSFRYEAVKR